MCTYVFGWEMYENAASAAHIISIILAMESIVRSVFWAMVDYPDIVCLGSDNVVRPAVADSHVQTDGVGGLLGRSDSCIHIRL